MVSENWIATINDEKAIVTGGSQMGWPALLCHKHLKNGGVILIIFMLDPLNSRISLSRGEICVANFIPPANGASQGNYFQAKIQKMANNFLEYDFLTKIS